MFNEDGSVNLKNNEQLKEVIDFYATMVKEGIFIEVNTWDEYIGTLSNQTVVGTIQGCWILSTVMSLQDQKGLWAMTNLPKLVKAEGATNYSSNGGSSWAIINGKDIDLALDFMQMYRNVEFYNEILPATSAIATYTVSHRAPPRVRARHGVHPAGERAVRAGLQPVERLSAAGRGQHRARRRGFHRLQPAAPVRQSGVPALLRDEMGLGL